jgi:hypothetical protein
MRYGWRSVLAAGLATCVFAGTGFGEVFVYPKGQSQQQFEKDQFECHQWATQQTGFNPSQPAPTAAPPSTAGDGTVARGAARGAAVGAVGGAIGGDAGKGAAVGAGVGAAAGVMKRNQHNKQVAASNQQAQQQQQANIGRYESAYKTCMKGRNYQVS